jgi:hypothetical protein
MIVKSDMRHVEYSVRHVVARWTKSYDGYVCVHVYYDLGEVHKEISRGIDVKSNAPSVLCSRSINSALLTRSSHVQLDCGNPEGKKE